MEFENTLPHQAGLALRLRAEVNKGWGVLRVPNGWDDVGLEGGANVHQAGGHYGYLLLVIALVT